MEHQRPSEPILIPQIDVAEAAKRQGEASILLDVRTLEEYQAGHAPNSVWIPLDEIVERFHELNRERGIVVICRSGGRSQRAAEFLAAQSYCTLNVAGGMAAWEAAGLEVTTDTGSPGDVI
jgi:rhodanese-related sulfurtransferase